LAAVHHYLELDGAVTVDGWTWRPAPGQPSRVGQQLSKMRHCAVVVPKNSGVCGEGRGCGGTGPGGSGVTSAAAPIKISSGMTSEAGGR
jgi:hypothetical protein